MSPVRRTAALAAICTLTVACEGTSPSSPTIPTASQPGTLTRVNVTDAPSTFVGIWRTRKPLPTPRKWNAAGVLSKSIVVVGGVTGVHTVIRRVDAYNVETRTWTQLKSLPAPRYAMLGATPINGKLYVAGGRSADSGYVVDEKTLFVYDPATNTWARKADLPRGAAVGVQASIGGRLYVYALGGTSDDLELFASYNPLTNRWTRLPVPGRLRLHQGGPVAGAINGKFYLTGGIDSWGKPARQLDVYDPVTKLWTTGNSMPTGRDGAFGSVFRGKLIVAGGAAPVPGADWWLNTDVVEAYDPVTDAWSTGPSMLRPRGGGSSAWAAGKLFAMGGEEALPIGLSDRVEALSTAY